MLTLAKAILCWLLQLYSVASRDTNPALNQGQCLVQKSASLIRHGSVTVDREKLEVYSEQRRQPLNTTHISINHKAWHVLKNHIFVWDLGNNEPWERRQARAKKTLHDWVMALRDFMLFTAWTFVSLVFLITMNNIRTHWRLPRMQTAGAQLLMAIAGLTIFPSLTSLSTERVIWVMALRYLTEGYATLLAMYVIPSVLGDYLDRALKTEKDLKRKHMSHGVTTLEVDLGPEKKDPLQLSEGLAEVLETDRSHSSIVQFGKARTEPAQGHERPVETSTVTAKAVSTAATRLHTSQERHLRPRKMVILEPAPLSLVFLLCCARPGLCIVRGFATIIWNDSGEDWVAIAIAVTFNVLNFTIILGSLGLGWYMVRRTFKHLAEYVPHCKSTAMTVSILPLIGASQDIMVAWLYGAEGLGISFAGLLYLHEVVAVFAIVAWNTLSENQPVVQLRGLEEVETPPKWGSWLIQVLDLRKTFYNSEDWPEYHEQKAVKTVSVLCRWVLADTHLSFMREKGGGAFKICAPYELTHHEEKWQRQGRLKVMTSWRTVLFDCFTSRVRSPILSVSFLACCLDRAFGLIGPAADWTNDLGIVYAGGFFLVMLELLWTCLVWAAGGLILLGNNVFMDRRWLITAFFFFLVNTVGWFRNFFLPPEFLAHDFSLLWRNFFRGCLSLTGLIATISVFTSPEIGSYFLQIEVTALRYTRSLFSGLLAHSAKKIRSVRLVNSMARHYPPILIVSALASVPMVIATAYYVVFSLTELLHGAQELQVSMDVINANVQSTSGGVSLLMATFDSDLDGKLSKTELEGLFRGLEAIGLREAGEEAFFLTDQPFNGGNRDGLLSLDECNNFALMMKQVAYAAQILAGDGSPEGKANKLLEMVGDKCLKPEKITQILRTAQLVMSPGTPPLIPDAQLKQAVADADVDRNGCLSGKELSQYLGHMRTEIVAKRAQVQALMGSLSNPSPQNLQNLAAQLSGLDLNKDGLDRGEMQPLISSLSLLSPDAAAAVPKLLEVSDKDMDGLLSTIGVPPLNGAFPGSVPGGGLPVDITAARGRSGNIPDLQAARSAAAEKAFNKITGKVAQDAQKAAEVVNILRGDALALQAANTAMNPAAGGNMRKAALAMQAARTAMNPLAGITSASGWPVLSLLQFEASMNSSANHASEGSTNHASISSATETSRASGEEPKLNLLQRMSGVAVQPGYDFQQEQTMALQRMVENSALIAVKALEQIAAGEMDAQNAAAAALQTIRSHSLNVLQQQNVTTSRIEQQPQETPKVQYREGLKKPKMPKVSQAPKAPKPGPQVDAKGMSGSGELVVFVQQLAPYLHKAAETAQALLTSLADDHLMAEGIFAQCDSNKDKAITKEELAKAIAPAVAPLYPLVSAHQLASAVILPGLVDADRDGLLEESELQHVTNMLSMVVANAFGDLNGDGSKDNKDLLAAAEHFGTAAQQSGTYFNTQQAKGLSLLSHGFRRSNFMKKASLVNVAIRQRLGEVATPDGEVFPTWITDYVSKVDRVLAIVPVERLKKCALIAGVLAFGFVLYILHTAFRGYRWMFVEMQTGRHQYPGCTGKEGQKTDKEFQKELRSQYGNSTLFLGLLMSSMVCGWLMAFGLVFVSLSLLMFTELWIQLWELRVFLLFLVVTKLVLIALRSVVIDAVLNDDGYITWPMTFSCVWVVLMILNFAIGLLASVCRFILLAPAMLYRFNTLDDTMVPEFLVKYDPGYYCLLSLTYTSYEQMNPICRSFITSVSSTVHRLHGPLFKTSAEVCNWESEHHTSEDTVEPASAEVIERAQRRKLIRNKWWLAVLVAHNPSLKPHRRAHGRHGGHFAPS